METSRPTSLFLHCLSQKCKAAKIKNRLTSRFFIFIAFQTPDLVVIQVEGRRQVEIGYRSVRITSSD
jgi:hypothetical protein